MKAKLANKKRKVTSMRLLMKIVWVGPQDAFKEEINEKLGGIVVVWIIN